MEHKSLLDGMQIKEKRLPIGDKPTLLYGIVGQCPRCGAPIHGPATVGPDSDNRVVIYTCDCRNRS